jgi:hypothetical protein
MRCQCNKLEPQINNKKEPTQDCDSSKKKKKKNRKEKRKEKK